jgi:hypothetical protein
MIYTLIGNSDTTTDGVITMDTTSYSTNGIRRKPNSRKKRLIGRMMDL